jgi:hypothetical protein
MKTTVESSGIPVAARSHSRNDPGAATGAAPAGSRRPGPEPWLVGVLVLFLIGLLLGVIALSGLAAISALEPAGYLFTADGVTRGGEEHRDSTSCPGCGGTQCCRETH